MFQLCDPNYDIKFDEKIEKNFNELLLEIKTNHDFDYIKKHCLEQYEESSQVYNSNSKDAQVQLETILSSEWPFGLRHLTLYMKQKGI